MPKFMRAVDWNRKPLKTPVIVQPKFDGVRGGNLNGVMSARSLKPFGNKHTNLYFSMHAFRGFDGELAAEAVNHPDLCRLTSSATSTHEGEPWLMWHVFDYVTPETIALPYIRRLEICEQKVQWLKTNIPDLGAHLTPIPWVLAKSMDDVEELIQAHIDADYEGTIIREYNGAYKEGYSSTKGGLLRVKPFIEVDAIVTKIHEGQRNENEAQLNEMGHTFRSTFKENMVPNGMVGSMDARLCEDALFNGRLVHKKGDMLCASAGRMDHTQRALFFQRPDLLVGKRCKVKIFPIGVKDKPRMPTWQSFRTEEDTMEHI